MFKIKRLLCSLQKEVTIYIKQTESLYIDHSFVAWKKGGSDVLLFLGFVIFQVRECG
jgi:hypothetical protein